MENRFDALFRPGNLALSMMAFAGLTLLAAFLWNVAPSFVLLLLIPALAVSFYQMVLSPVYGLRMDDERLTVMTEDGTRVVPFKDVAHIRVTDQESASRVTLVLHDGAEVAIPFDMPPGQLDLIRAVTDRGIAVRST
ncbi:hypothetical protein [Roseicyclus mahoneyensis]|jgi:hypothetical protein|uniref:PH (Pleckstrin Homology) domain-containing protein n=1 Tax=Roseicyclus mahoneyensis TaxID=164332 RepID=A0A316GME6_9RHOB|nr:hypothetical protein [Roseicyclus mahoneyensis]PWK62094.1 hypothetical protein C7455_101120 [Roseicyclus mahoneyensis]